MLFEMPNLLLARAIIDVKSNNRCHEGVFLIVIMRMEVLFMISI